MVVYESLSGNRIFRLTLVPDNNRSRFHRKFSQSRVGARQIKFTDTCSELAGENILDSEMQLSGRILKSKLSWKNSVQLISRFSTFTIFRGSTQMNNFITPLFRVGLYVVIFCCNNINNVCLWYVCISKASCSYSTLEVINAPARHL